MKPELAVLPLEVWADIFVYPWITRRQLAQIVHRFRNRKFAEKLQFRLHDMGKHTLNYLDLDISSKYPNSNKVFLTVTHTEDHESYNDFIWRPKSKDCELPECEMPENIKSFKHLSIRHFDHQVLGFLDKIKPTFTNVFVRISGSISAAQAKNLRILMDHLFPMVAGIRGFGLNHDGIELLGRHFPEHLARAKAIYLSLTCTDKFTSIPACLNWLSAPHNFGGNVPRFLKIHAAAKTIFAIVDAVRKQFLAARSSSTFAIFLEFNWYHHRQHHRAAVSYVNAVTNEQLSIRNANFTHANAYSNINIDYVEIVRHPLGEADKMRDWLKQRAYYERMYNRSYDNDNGTMQEISIDLPTRLIIGQITKKNGKAGAWDQDKDKSTDHDDGEDAAGQSTSSAKK